jgi:diadenylate cyclase
MANSITSLIQQLSYLYNHITVGQVIDISLTALVFFIAFQALYQTRALQLLRGVVVAAILGGGLIMLMPLATLSWLVRILLIAGAIAIPILFQDELRWALVGLGQFGRRRLFGSDYERFKHTLSESLSHIASRNEGALIVLEGQTRLEEIIATGIRLQAEVVTPELLETIFFHNTPMHDGAVVMRGDRLAAASCILPVQSESTGERHLGLRHRAALGLTSKVPDALILVVSEESGGFSVAWGGKLYSNLSLGELEGWLDQFEAQPVENSRQRWGWLRGGDLRSTLINILTSILLAVIAWLVVIYQTNPPGQVVIQGVPLAVSGPSAGMTLMSAPPATVNVELQTTRDRIGELTAASLLAELNLLGLPAGVHSVPVQVSAADPSVQVLSVTPVNLDMSLEQELTRPITPTVMIADLNSMPTGYVVGEPALSPASLSLSGARSLVESVAEARITLLVGERRTDFQVPVRPLLLDSEGKPVEGVQTNPQQVVVTVPVRRTAFTRQVGIQPTLDEKGLDANYEIRSLEVLPSMVTLTGPQSVLDSAEAYLVTAPISLTNHYSDFVVEAPLVVPYGLAAVDEQGEMIQSVQVKIGIAPMTGYLVLERELDFLNQPAATQATAEPARVSVLLIGPQALLAEITENPQIVSVQVDLANLAPGPYTLPVLVQAPQGFQVQLFPKEVLVVIQ